MTTTITDTEMKIGEIIEVGDRPVAVPELPPMREPKPTRRAPAPELTRRVREKEPA